MRLLLTGKRLLITGSTQGLGETVARAALDCEAAAVILTGRNAARGTALAAELGPRARFITADLSQEGAAERLIADALSIGDLDGLVNAAGITNRGSLVDATPALWAEIFAINARAPFFLMQGLVRHLRARGAPGSIVNIQSINAHCGSPELAVYSASKGALATLTRNAAHAHLAERIRVNGINMGWTVTPGEAAMQGVTLGKGPDWLAQAAAAMPLGRLLSMEEVSNLTLYLLSDLSGMQTGTIIDLEQSVIGAPR